MTTKSAQCASCHKLKASLHCGMCYSPVCKSCTQFIEDNCFSFLEEVPEHLTHKVYCPNCWDDRVAPELREYNQAMKRAKEVFIFFNTQGKETRLMARNAEPVRVRDCADRDETILRLGFLAAKAGYNAVIDVDLSYEKVRIGAYQTTKWHATGIPTQVDKSKYNRK